MLWVIDGYLRHNLSFKRLFKVSETYQRINAVPEGYMYAELYLCRKNPDSLRLLEDRVKDYKRYREAQAADPDDSDDPADFPF